MYKNKYQKNRETWSNCQSLWYEMLVNNALHLNDLQYNFHYNQIICYFTQKRMETKDDFISRTIKTEKLFNFTSGQCYYANIEITKKIEKSGQDSKIKILNSVCKSNDSNLLKVTQIRFGNRVIYIEDSYCFKSPNQKDYQIIPNNSSAPTNSSDGSQNNNPINEKNNSRIQGNGRKRKLIFKKKTPTHNSLTKMEKRNTKNVAKNFCKAFITYLEEENYQELSKKLKKLVEIYRFNNKVIEKIAKDESLSNQFKRFLGSKADEWIQSSKIHDKQIHCEAIKLYLQLIESGSSKIGDDECCSDSSSKSIYHSDSPFDGSSEDNGRQSHQK